jgi:hypothetical protein
VRLRQSQDSRAHRRTSLQAHESRVGGALECSLSMTSRSLASRISNSAMAALSSRAGMLGATIYRFVSPRSPWPFGTFGSCAFVRSERLADIDDLVEFAFRIATHVAFVAFGRLDEFAPAGGSLFRGHRLSPVDCSTIHHIPAHRCAEQ